MSVTVRVPAKVNVQLAVGAPRPDGFHDLANVFLAVGLYDEVKVTPADALSVTCSGPDAAQVPLDAGNLAARAAIALADRHGISPDVHIRQWNGPVHRPTWWPRWKQDKSNLTTYRFARP
ncbi:hypothetical protein AB0P40_43760, partial [Streptomyces sp. NPDC079189]